MVLIISVLKDLSRTFEQRTERRDRLSVTSEERSPVIKYLYLANAGIKSLNSVVEVITELILVVTLFVIAHTVWTYSELVYFSWFGHAYMIFVFWPMTSLCLGKAIYRRVFETGTEETQLSSHRPSRSTNRQRSSSTESISRAVLWLNRHGYLWFLCGKNKWSIKMNQLLFLKDHLNFKKLCYMSHKNVLVHLHIVEWQQEFKVSVRKT